MVSVLVLCLQRRTNRPDNEANRGVGGSWAMTWSALRKPKEPNRRFDLLLGVGVLAGLVVLSVLCWSVYRMIGPLFDEWRKIRKGGRPWLR